MTISEQLKELNKQKTLSERLYDECGFENNNVLSNHCLNLSTIVLSCDQRNQWIDDNWEGLIFEDKNDGKIRVPTYNLIEDNVLRVKDFYGNNHALSDVTEVQKTPNEKTIAASFMFSNNSNDGKTCTNVHHIHHFSSDYITVLSISTFNWVKDLHSVSIPKLKTLTNAEFRNCESLSSIDIPNIEEIKGPYQFIGVKNLSMDLSFPRLSSISNSSGIFQGMVWCKSISIPKANTVPLNMFKSIGWNYTGNGIAYVNVSNVSSIANFSFQTRPNLCIDFRDRDPSLYSQIPIPEGLSIFNKTDQWNNSKNISVFVPSAMYETWIHDEDWLNNVSAVLKSENRNFYILSSEGR